MYNDTRKPIMSTRTTDYITESRPYFYVGAAAATWYLPARTLLPPLRRSERPVFVVTCEPGAGPLTISGTDANFSYGPSASTTITLMPGESVMIHDDGGFWIASFMPTASLYRRVASAQTGAAVTLTRAASVWPFTGTAASAWTLPAVSLNRGMEYLIHNRGTASITLAPNGSDTINTGAVTVPSVIIAPGQSMRVFNDGSTWVADLPPVRRLRSGKYYGDSGVAFGTATPTADRLRVTPWIVPESGVYDRIASEVTAAVAATTLRWGLYRDGGGYPGALILDSGAVGDASTVGVKEATIAATLTAGERIWKGVAPQGGNPTMRTLSGSISLPDVGVDLADISTFSGVAVGYFTSAAGALPSPFTAGASVQNTAPAIWLRKA
ncbi:hypothetical protein CH296_28255 [Rhodococcus sp. 14-2496-1d]|uniref:hypothetical protein n=1 Tax=Rhodococcus sp. 14-2496-1d TaxID=2023146 RepID=UPI000B9AA430|nr:hypothetical protein [Rhodococcus sp. 14-2496-1d]OZF24606.1 hypothetical protein CH296_28255 [Rhodococcus sp. 14-2496-1d]